MYKAFITRATSGDSDNGPVIESILALRQEQANLTGYANYAEFSLASKVLQPLGPAPSKCMQVHAATCDCCFFHVSLPDDWHASPRADGEHDDSHAAAGGAALGLIRHSRAGAEGPTGLCSVAGVGPDCACGVVLHAQACPLPRPHLARV